jgi:hypothetical protein
MHNWLPIESYIKSVNDWPKILKKHFSDEDPEKMFVLEAYFNSPPTLVPYFCSVC